MAEGETVDLDSLTAEQQAALQQYTSVTDQDVGAAIPLLQRAQWNVVIAISQFFDDEPATDPVAEAIAAQAPQNIRRQEVLMNGFSSTASRTTPNLEPAPRIVPPSESTVGGISQLPLIIRLLSLPLNVVYTILLRGFRLLNWFIPVLPRLVQRFGGSAGPGRPRHTAGRRPLSPRDSAARFIREFREEYGSNELQFQETGYAQALDKAKKELKFLLVLLLSPEHDSTSEYVRQTLLAREVADFLKSPESNIIIWAGTVQDPEAYAVGDGLRCTKFPFAALICHTPDSGSTAMSIIARLAGPMEAPTFLSKMQRSMDQHSAGLTSARRSRTEQQATRSLREQQNSAYERSLAQDQERDRVRREQEDAKRREEEDARRLQQEKDTHQHNYDLWRRWRASSIEPEPDATAIDAVRISIRLADGTRVIRKFAAQAPLEELYAFVECHDILKSSSKEAESGGSAPTDAPPNFSHEYKFRLVSPMPREVYAIEAGGTVRDRIGRSGNLIVERANVGDSDEDEDDDTQ